jgi:hypothetical protein
MEEVLCFVTLLTPALASAETTKFRIEEATIEDIQATIGRGQLTSTRVVPLYLNRIKVYNDTFVNQPDGILGLGPIIPIRNAHQLNASCSSWRYGSKTIQNRPPHDPGRWLLSCRAS